jgi:phosphoribosyl 1,2-cyclic phosphate phosphodiesterase
VDGVSEESMQGGGELPVVTERLAANVPSFIAEMIIMGTGTSIGVPVVGCRCDVCLSNNPRNRRMRSGVLLRAPEGELIIDAGPELRLQLIRERATLIRAALMTHGHADHIMGIDDLRIFGFQLNSSVPLYCEEFVEQQIRHTFSYAFTDPASHAHQYAAPRLRFERINAGDKFEVLGLNVEAIRLKHGELPILGFRMENVAFCTDVSTISAASKERLQGLDVLILDTLRRDPHPTHLHLDAALKLIHQLRPKMTYLTHMSHELDYDELIQELPDYIQPAYDGLRIPIAACASPDNQPSN